MPDDNVAAIQRLYDALAARDASVIQEHVSELRDGKVVRYQSYIDTPVMLEALSR